MADLYSVLGVAKGASQQDIKKTYRKLAATLHPDKNPGAANEKRFKDVTTAYEVLGDEKKRKLYDEFGEVSLRPGFDEQQARAARNFGGFNGGR
ncbi:MAG: DnaJ domain-containing protein, partial [Myxococcota bacterium]